MTLANALTNSRPIFEATLLRNLALANRSGATCTALVSTNLSLHHAAPEGSKLHAA